LPLTTFPLYQAWPSEGPRRSFSKLQLLGDGFWDAPNIIVKFTFKQAQLSAASAASTNNKAAASRPALPGTNSTKYILYERKFIFVASVFYMYVTIF